MAGNHSTWQTMPVRPWLIVVVAAACDRGAVTGTGADGAQLYQSVCATCHGPAGKPTEAMVARLGVRDLTSAELRARITPELVEKQIRTGSDNKLMPSFVGALTDEQIKAIAAFVASPELGELGQLGKH
jgi:mono/diheme cytochrome c family protein